MSGKKRHDHGGNKFDQSDEPNAEWILGDLIHLPADQRGLHIQHKDEKEPGENIQPELWMTQHLVSLFHARCLWQCQEMLSMVIVFFQCVNNGLQMFWIAKKVRIARIHKNGFNVVLADIMGIGLLNVEQVIIGNFLLIRAVAPADVLL